MSNVENKTTQITEAVAVETVVRCTEIDVNGHLNNAKFVEYLEWGREEWYESHGFGYDHLEELRVITVVLAVAALAVSATGLSGSSSASQSAGSHAPAQR